MVGHHNITMTSQWPRWRLKLPASRLFTQPFIQTPIKENIKAPRHRPLCGEFTGTGEFPARRASYAENVSIWWRHHYETVRLIHGLRLPLFPIKPPLVRHMGAGGQSWRWWTGSSSFIPNKIQQYNKYRVHDQHNQQQCDHSYCNVILLVATREAMGLSGWQPDYIFCIFLSHYLL